MTRLISFLIIVAFTCLGAFRQHSYINRMFERVEYTKKYRDRFVKLTQNVINYGKLNNELYYELIAESNRIQRELGNEGLAFFQDPLAGLQTGNYPLFLNVFSEIRSYLSMPNPKNDRLNQIVGLCDEALVKHIGTLFDIIEIEKRKQYNPFFCFSNGIRFAISLPVQILEWCGLINGTISVRLLESKVMKTVNWIITLIGLIASILTIAIGWEKLIQLI